MLDLRAEEDDLGVVDDARAVPGGQSKWSSAPHVSSEPPV